MLKIRAHHLLCTENFVGEGYSDEFSKNMTRVLKELTENPKVKLLADLDDICGPCPENLGHNCKNDDLVKSYDKRVLEFLNLSQDEIYSWEDIKKLACDIIFSKNRREEICGECQWNALGTDVEAKRR